MKNRLCLSIILLTFFGCNKIDPESCFDAIQNQNETGVDCGGVCPPCTQTLTLIPNADEGVDAMIMELPPNGSTTNFGNYPLITLFAGTNNSVPVKHRSLLFFDLSSIQQNTTIVSATLFLYGDNNSSAFPMGHVSLNGSNSWMIQRITSHWEEDSVSWSNQPTTTNQNAVLLSASSSNYQDYVVDVTEVVQDMVNEPQFSYGFMFRLLKELEYNRILFASSDNVNPNLFPKLVVEYQ